MSELISAQKHSMDILNRVIRSISASIIQKTWRSWKKTMAERNLAEIYKIENTFSCNPSWTSGAANYIKDLLEPLEVIKNGTRVTIDPTSYIMCNDNSDRTEDTVVVDGDDKSSVIYTKLVNNWVNYIGDKALFFNNYAKRFVDHNYSSDWCGYFEETISFLKVNSYLCLWGSLGGFKVLRGKDLNCIRELYNYWKLFCIKRDISKIRSDSHTDAASFSVKSYPRRKNMVGGNYSMWYPSSTFCTTSPFLTCDMDDYFQKNLK